MGISKQEYQSGLPSPQPRDQTSSSCTAGKFFTTEPLGKPNMVWYIDLFSDVKTTLYFCDK